MAQPFQPVLDQLLQRNLATSGAASTSTTPGVSSVLKGLLPGMSGLTSGATDVIGNLINGQPSTGTARRANAYFGARSGMPGSDFVRNRGFDLYGQQGEERKQTGIKDFLALLSGLAPIAGQDEQSSQFNEKLGLDRGQAAINNAMEQNRFNLERDIRQPAPKEYSSSFTPASGGQPRYSYRYFR